MSSWHDNDHGGPCASARIGGAMAVHDGRGPGPAVNSSDPRGGPGDPRGRLDVLIVDDEKNIRQTLGLFLEKQGCGVHLASSGETALASLGRYNVDLAFLDLRLGT